MTSVSKNITEIFDHFNHEAIRKWMWNETFVGNRNSSASTKNEIFLADIDTRKEAAFMKVLQNLLTNGMEIQLN